MARCHEGLLQRAYAGRRSTRGTYQSGSVDIEGECLAKGMPGHKKAGQGPSRPPGPCRSWRAGAAPPPARSAPVRPLSKNRFEPSAPWNGRPALRNEPEIRGAGEPDRGTRGLYLGTSGSHRGTDGPFRGRDGPHHEAGACFPERTLHSAERMACSEEQVRSQTIREGPRPAQNPPDVQKILESPPPRSRPGSGALSSLAGWSEAGWASRHRRGSLTTESTRSRDLGGPSILDGLFLCRLMRPAARRAGPSFFSPQAEASRA